ncbi:MAG: hypothetical protein U1A16_00295 [Patescibacteria group bacterium]|nr:hypothetical protein [Patescibacteria group bacterium]
MKESIEQNMTSHEEERFVEKAEVNGIKISVGWDDSLAHQEHTIYFPQIAVGEKASTEGVADQIIRVGQNQELAKHAFYYAEGVASMTNDVYDVYRRVEKFVTDKRETKHA